MDGTATETEIGLTEAAHRLGVGYLTARELMLRHQLDGLKRGARWVVTVRSVERFAQERERAVTAA